MKNKILLICFGLFFISGCSSKPNNKMAEDVYSKKYAIKIEDKILQIKSFNPIGKPITSVFDFDCQKLPCFEIKFKAELEILKYIRGLGYNYKKGEIVEKNGSIYFKKTENGWETEVKQNGIFF
jgi:hypothetical protein